MPCYCLINNCEYEQQATTFPHNPASQRTHKHVVLGLLSHFRCVGVGALQVDDEEDVGGKVQHVLLSTAVRHAQQVAKVLDQRAQQVSCW